MCIGVGPIGAAQLILLGVDARSVGRRLGDLGARMAKQPNAKAT